MGTQKIRPIVPARLDITPIEALTGSPEVAGEWFPNAGPFLFTKPGVPVGFVAIRVVDTNPDGTEKHLYTHVMRAEGAGGVFLPVNAEGKVGLQLRHRFQVTNMEGWTACFAEYGRELCAGLKDAWGNDPRYEALKKNGALTESALATIGKDVHNTALLHHIVRKAAKEAFGDYDFSAIGRACYEVPRGYGPIGATGIQTAVREAGENTGRVILTTHSLGEVCDNTAQSFNTTALTVGVLGEKVSDTDPDPGAPSKMPAVEYFSLKDLARLRGEGRLYCNFTLGAIAAYMIASVEDPTRFPPLK